MGGWKTGRSDGRRRWRLRTLVVAALLAVSLALLSAIAVSADYWPHAPDGGAAAAVQT